MSGIKAAGLIAAAGMSSRMGAFKPLLDLAGKPLICRTAESLLAGGAEQVVVVTGRNHEAVQQALAGYTQVVVLHNADYATTAMFDSIRIGLQELQQYDAVLFLPGDVPCVRPETVRCLLAQWEEQCPDVLYPVYDDGTGRIAHWHPPVIAGSCIPELLQYDGLRGLQGALAALATHAVEVYVPDAGCTMDADYAQDYQRLCQYWPRRYYPSPEECRAFYQLAETPETVQQHCEAVAQKALELAQAIQQRGLVLRLELLESAAYLHDICRTQAHHAQAGAEFLRRYGLTEVAALVAVHMDWPQAQVTALDEAAILYLADKLVTGNQAVSLAQRFAEKERLFREQPEVLKKISHRKNIALQISELVQQSCGIVIT